MENTIIIYQSYPNQKLVITKKAQSDAEHTYGILNNDAAFTAARILSDRAFKLYVRMNLHQDNCAYALSPVEIQNAIGMSDTRYRQAVKELIAKGYLVQSAERRNLYTFFESPDRRTNSAETTASSGECIEDESLFDYSSPSDTKGEIIHSNEIKTKHTNKKNNTPDSSMPSSVSSNRFPWEDSPNDFYTDNLSKGSNTGASSPEFPPLDNSSKSYNDFPNPFRDHLRKQGSQKQADENASLTFFDPDDAIFFEKPEEVPSDTPSVIPDDSGIIFVDEEEYRAMTSGKSVRVAADFSDDDENLPF